MKKEKSNLSTAQQFDAKEQFQFDYIFSPEEIKEKSKQLSRACIERNQIEDEKKSTVSIFKSKTDSKTAEINILSEQISSGKELVTKMCEVKFDFDKAIKEYFYEGVKVGEGKMTSKDFQLQIDTEEF